MQVYRYHFYFQTLSTLIRRQCNGGALSQVSSLLLGLEGQGPSRYQYGFKIGSAYRYMILDRLLTGCLQRSM